MVGPGFAGNGRAGTFIGRRRKGAVEAIVCEGIQAAGTVEVGGVVDQDCRVEGAVGADGVNAHGERSISAGGEFP